MTRLQRDIVEGSLLGLFFVAGICVAVLVLSVIAGLFS